MLSRCLACLSLFASAAAADPGETPNTRKLGEGKKPAAAKIADLAFLKGRWVGEGLGGKVEEVWCPPLGDSMMGAFRVVKDGKVSFHEICTIVEDEGSVTLKIKHFDSALKGWEEKDVAQTFKLVESSPDAAYFDGATYLKDKDGTLKIYVAARRKNQPTRELAFRFTKAD